MVDLHKGQQEWSPKNTNDIYTITPYKSITYCFSKDGEDVGDIAVVDMVEEFHISLISVRLPYLNKGMEALFVRFVLEKHPEVVYIYPNNPQEVEWLSDLGFEPMYIEDWGPNPERAPWDKGYREMLFIPNPTQREQAASFHKRFLMALSNYVSDVSNYETLIQEHKDYTLLTWRNKDITIHAHFGLTSSVKAIWEGVNGKRVVSVDCSTYYSINKLAKWFAIGDSIVIPH